MGLIGSGSKVSVDPRVREWILRTLYVSGAPTTLAELVNGLERTPVTSRMIWKLLILDTLRVMEDNGDLISSHVTEEHRLYIAYHLSPKEFLRTVNANHSAEGQQAGGGACHRVWRFLCRLFGR